MSTLNLWERVKAKLNDVRIDLCSAGFSGHVDTTDTVAEVTALLAEMERVECVEGALSSDWIRQRFPWISGRMFTHDGNALDDMYREVRDAMAEERPTLLLLLEEADNG